MNQPMPQDFPAFFNAIWDAEPFPWQKRLADLVCDGRWPKSIDLPTASGKTACLDIAVFALAVQAARTPQERTVGRRIFFVVNRRVIVDEAYERARTIARALYRASGDGTAARILRSVAMALREVSGETDAPPLDVAMLRGGIVRDNRWARSIAQPTIITSTIDQVGSRFLFRGYGVTPEAAPIHAALVAHDSTILLDEAHLSRPFAETVEAIDLYRGEQWAHEPIRTPFRFVPMTATPGDARAEVFRLDDKDREHPRLKERHGRAKPVELRVAERARGKRAIDELAADLADQAIGLQSGERQTVAVVVNRIATAKAVYERLRDRLNQTVDEERRLADVCLVIGGMRPLDRDALTRMIQSRVGKSRTADVQKPLFVVATQCLEVGADFDFDAMVCECASIDALRQRFGRLNRNGREIAAHGMVVIRADQVDGEDSIYGAALAKTWAWLRERARDDVVDFGVNAMNSALENVEIEPLTAPRSHAPILFPAYLDAWTQTSPTPAPDPDVSLFLHGQQHGEPDVNICWREDLPGSADEAVWRQVISLCPPSSPECLPTPIGVFRDWLVGDSADSDDRSDLLGALVPEPRQGRRRVEHLAFVWRGAERSVLIRDANEVRPGDTLVLRASDGGRDLFGHVPVGARTDLAEQAYRQSRGRAILRLTSMRLASWPASEPVEILTDWVENPDSTLGVDELRDLLRRAAEMIVDDDLTAETMRLLAEEKRGPEWERYPTGPGVQPGIVLRTRRRIPLRDPFEDLPAMDDGEDETSRSDRETPVPLTDHLRHVRQEAEGLVERLPVQKWRDALCSAAELHDWGKADERFQALLIDGDRSDAWAQPTLWAKSARVPTSPEKRRAAHRRAGLPAGFRHEMLSQQMAALATDHLPTDGGLRDLVLHLVASHHGRARPFAPVVLDVEPPSVDLRPLNIAIGLTAEQRKADSPHRLDSGISDRFWSLTRRFGWWGLAYLEAVLRLADQRASQREEDGDAGQVKAGAMSSSGRVAPISSYSIAAPHRQFPRGLILPGIDGSNPLGFLAALGVLRTITVAFRDGAVAMNWVNYAGAWRPKISFAHPGAPDDEAGREYLVQTLADSLADRFEQHPASAVGASSGPTLRDQTGACTIGSRDASVLDWLSALSSDLDKDLTSQLQTVRRDYFLGNLRSIVERTKKDHLSRCLFKPWHYSDPLENQSLHFDPIEDRRHAYQWNKPSGDPDRKRRGGMLGANRLAIEAIPLFQSVFRNSRLLTRGFRGTRADNTRWTWPIWACRLTCDVVASLLGLADIQADVPDVAALKSRGIECAFRCSRILVEKTPCFTPAVAIV